MNIGTASSAPPVAPSQSQPAPKSAPVDRPNDGDADDAAPVKAAVASGVGGKLDISA